MSSVFNIDLYLEQNEKQLLNCDGIATSPKRFNLNSVLIDPDWVKPDAELALLVVRDWSDKGDKLLSSNTGVLMIFFFNSETEA